VLTLNQPRSKHYCKTHSAPKVVEKKFDSLAKNVGNNFSVYARTDTMEISISSSSATTEQDVV